MPIADFLTHINDPAPGFACFYAGDRSETEGWTARVTHHLNAPASPSSIEKLCEWLGSFADPFEELYRLHDGMILYQDTIVEILPPSPSYSNKFMRAAGIELYPVLEWPDRSSSVIEDPLSFGWDQEEIEQWKHSSPLFGEICHSANYFAVRTRGPDAGSIYYLNHDPSTDSIDELMATNLEGFLDRIVADPAGFLYSRGCYTRYHDGRTNEQWIPKTYFSDVGK